MRVNDVASNILPSLFSGSPLPMLRGDAREDDDMSGRGLHSFPFPLNLSLLCPFPLNLSLICPPYNPN